MDAISYSLAAKAIKGLENKVDLNGNAVSIPVGGNSDRPVLGSGDRVIRFNNDIGGLEEWNGSVWKNVSADVSAVNLKGTDTEASILALVGMAAEDLWIASDTLNGWVYDGSVWINIGPLQGPQGVQGIDGKSAYDVAVVNGFAGTEADWLLSLVGPTGPTGNGINSVAKTDTVGLVDTYTVTMTSGDTTTFTVTNGVDGLGVDHIAKTSGTGAAGTVDVHTVWGDVAETVNLGTFNVYNGYDGIASTVGSLVDVDLTTTPVEDGQTIVWNEAEGKWLPGNAGTGTGAVINTPSITSPINGATDTEVGLTITGSPYSTAITYTGTHTSSVLEIATDSGFTSIVSTITVGLESFIVSGLNASTTYYARLRYISGDNSSGWSDTVSFTTMAAGITDPTITSPTNGATEVSKTIEITASAYNAYGHSEGHNTTSWQISTDVAFSNIVEQSLNDVANLTSYTASELADNTQYYVRVKYESSSYSSAYSTAVTFTTKNVGINYPIITSPTNGETGISKNVNVAASSYSVFGGLVEAHTSTDWQIASDTGFNTIVSESIANTTNLTSWTSGDLTESTTYYIRARYNSANYTSGWTTTVSFSTAASFSTEYGLEWNNIADTYTRLGAAASWTTGADFTNNPTVQSLMRRCVLNANGTVNYYLSATNSAFREDGVTAADLTGASGNVMVEIPKFYCKYDNTDGAKQMWISTAPASGYVVHPAFIKNGVEVDYRYYRAYKGSTSGGKLISRSGVAATGNKTIAAFRTEAKANGTGWGLVDWHLLFAVQTLLFIEIGTFNSQSVLGNGNDTGADYGMTTGGSNSIGNASSPATNDDTWMSYRGIENFYADIFEWIDGINMNERLVYTSNTQSTFASDVFSGAYTGTGVTLPSSGYIKGMSFSIKGFIPTNATGGSGSTYVTDYVGSSAGARVAAFGGTSVNGLICGAACLDASNASAVAGAAVGAGISF